MVKAQRDDKLLNEQKRPRQEGPDRNDPTRNDMATQHSITPKNKAYINHQRRMRKENLPLSTHLIYHFYRSNMRDVCY